MTAPDDDLDDIIAEMLAAQDNQQSWRAGHRWLVAGLERGAVDLDDIVDSPWRWLEHTAAARLADVNDYGAARMFFAALLWHAVYAANLRQRCGSLWDASPDIVSALANGALAATDDLLDNTVIAVDRGGTFEVAEVRARAQELLGHYQPRRRPTPSIAWDELLLQIASQPVADPMAYAIVPTENEFEELTTLAEKVAVAAVVDDPLLLMEEARKALARSTSAGAPSAIGETLGLIHKPSGWTALDGRQDAHVELVAASLAHLIGATAQPNCDSSATVSQDRSVAATALGAVAFLRSPANRVAMSIP